MALEFSLVERNRIANDFFGGEDIVIKAYSNTISATGTGGTEITADGYEPIAITNNTTNFPVATTGTRSNAVEFSKAFTEDASISSYGIWAGSTFLGRVVFSSPFVVSAGQNWRFPVSSITYTPQNPA